MKKSTVVAADLFAGGGGLSLGLRQAGFEVASAIEINEQSAATYARNHPDTSLIVDDIQNVAGADIIASSPTGRIDLLAGCAPCQGFSSLTTKYRREDPRNLLVLEMARLIEEILPDLVVMENVPGLVTKGAHLFEEFTRRLRGAGYYCRHQVVQMADYGVPQNRRRLLFLAGRGFAIPFPKPTHTKNPKPGSPLRPWKTVRDAISNFGPPTRFDKVASAGGPQSLDWHVVRRLQRQTLERLKLAKPGQTWRSLDEAIRPKCHQGKYIGFTNVYGRMEWDKVSPTITTGCTTPAKGRFGHPDRRRTTISIREAATLQTFPEVYEFASDHIDAVCEIIGNAVPPAFGHKIGQQVLLSLQAHRQMLA